MEQALSAIQLCLSNEVMRKVIEETTIIGLWIKLETLYMNKSLMNWLYLKHQLYTFKMKEGMLIKDHFGKFNRVILDLWNIDVKVEDYHQALILLCSLTPSYDHFINVLL